MSPITVGMPMNELSADEIAPRKYGSGRKPGSGKWGAILHKYCNPASPDRLQPGQSVPVQYAEDENRDHQHQNFVASLAMGTANWFGQCVSRPKDAVTGRLALLRGEFRIVRRMDGGSQLVCATDEEYAAAKLSGISRHTRNMNAGLAANSQKPGEGGGEPVTAEMLEALKRSKRGQNPQDTLARMRAKLAAPPAPVAPVESAPAPKKKSTPPPPPAPKKAPPSKPPAKPSKPGKGR